jgi:hypothetical protein
MQKRHARPVLLQEISSGTAKRADARAEMIKVEMDKRIAEIPWQNYTQYPNERLDELREWVLARIYELDLLK